MRSRSLVPYLVTVVVVSALTANARLEAQDARAEVLKAVKNFFDAVAVSDTATVRFDFASSATITSSAIDKQRVVARTANVTDFVTSLGAASDAWSYRVKQSDVTVTGNVAQYVATFDFMAGMSRSYCGAMVLQLEHVGTRWVIAHMAEAQEYQVCA